MQAYKTQARIEPDGRMALSGLPFAEGTLVEVLVVNQSRIPGKQEAELKDLNTPRLNHTAEKSAASRLGFMAGEISVPDDFDALGSETIEALFEERAP